MSNKETRYIPVIEISKAAAIAAGFGWHLPKPVEPIALVETIVNLLM